MWNALREELGGNSHWKFMSCVCNYSIYKIRKFDGYILSVQKGLSKWTRRRQVWQRRCNTLVVGFHYKPTYFQFLEGYVGEVPTNEGLRPRAEEVHLVLLPMLYGTQCSNFHLSIPQLQFSSYLLIAKRRLWRSSFTFCNHNTLLLLYQESDLSPQRSRRRSLGFLSSSLREKKKISPGGDSP